MDLGETIYRLRMERGLSQEDLADQLEVSRQSISKWENGSSVPELEKLLKLSDLFEVTLDALVGREETTSLPPQPTAPEPPPASPVNQNLTRPQIIGLFLFGTAALIWMLSSLHIGFLNGLILAFPLGLCGIVCLFARSHVLLWSFWALFFSVDIYIRYGTGIRWGMILLTPIFEGSWNYSRLFIAWVEFFCFVILITVTVFLLQKKPLVPTKGNRNWILAGWVLFFLLRGLLFLPLDPLSLLSNLIYIFYDWVRCPLFIVLVSATIRYIRGWRRSSQT